MLYNNVCVYIVCNTYNMYMRVGMSCYDVICSLTLCMHEWCMMCMQAAVGRRS